MSELAYTAYHEAGPAVIGTLLGGVVHIVTIEPPREDGPPRYGDTHIEWPLAGVSFADQALREVKTALAGPAAEAVYRDEYQQLRITQENSADWLAASQHASTLLADELQRNTLLHHIFSQQLHLLRCDERVWSAVAAVADALLAHEMIESEQIEELVGFWMR